MRINRVRLQNIKSYIDQTIGFYDGVNFISGINGSGKSTIIESIGYALFDVKPYNFSEFVRYGESTGQISVWFEADDEREYLVERKFSNRNHINWIIYDVETDAEVESGQDDVLSWLNENLSIGSDNDSKELFDRVVGVKQGMFSAPFIMSPKERNNHFNPILKVDSYRRAYEGTRECQSKLNDQINSLGHEIELNQQKVEGYDEKNRHLQEIFESIARLVREIESLEKKQGEDQDRYNKLKEIKESAEEKGKLIERLRSQIAIMKRQLRQLNEELQKAIDATKIIQKTEAGYRKFLEAGKIISGLKADQKKRDQLEKLKNKLEKECLSLKTQIESDEKNIASQRLELSQKLEITRGELLEIEELFETAKTDIQQKRMTCNDIQNSGKAIDALYESRTSLENMIGQIQEKLRQINQQKKEAESLVIKLADYQTQKAIADQQRELRELLDNERNNVSQIRERIKIAQDNMKKSKGGKCPFLGQECKNIEGGDLEEYFASQLSKLEEELKTPSAKVAELQQKLDIAQEASKIIASLDKDRERLQSIRKQIGDLESDSIELEGRINVSPISEFLTSMSENPLSEGLDQTIGEVTDRIAVLQDSARDFGTLENRLDDYRLIADETEQCVSTLRKAFESMSTSARDKLDEAIAKLTKLETNHDNKVEEIENLEQNLMEMEAKSEKLDAQRNALKQKETELEIKKDELSAYKDIDSKLEEAEKDQDVYKGDYEAYLSHQQQAQRLNELESQFADLSGDIEDKKTEVAKLQTEAEALMANFDEEQYSRLDINIRQLASDISSRKTTLQERMDDKDQLQEELADMDRIKKDIANLEDKRKKYIAIFETMKFMRDSVFNKAGDLIADVYRRSISAKANEIYRQISNENVSLEWEQEYEVVLTTKSGRATRRRIFKQLSGGEQMSAALAIRLALLGMLSNVKIGIFDEPTANMDEQRRLNLSQVIPAITEDFRQLFVISHDDSFDSITENVIHLRKTETEGTILDQD